MLRVGDQVKLNTPEQVREYLREALAIVDELNPPPALQAAVFDKAAEFVSSKQVVVESIGTGGLAIPMGGQG